MQRYRYCPPTPLLSILFVFLTMTITSFSGCDETGESDGESADIHLSPTVFRTPSGKIEVVNFRLKKGSTPKKEKSKFAASEEVKIAVFTKKGEQFDVPIAPPAVPKPAIYDAADSLIVLSDIEGNFKAFSSFLKNNGVIDKNFNWTFGKNQLVLLGDFFDRGDQVFESLWLIYKLEQEAGAAGGSVHFILGNHEQMNLIGQYEYVHGRYKVLAEAFKFPYEDRLKKGSVLGDWLRAKNGIEQIGKTLFVHGGLSPALAATESSAEKINAAIRTALVTPHQKQTKLQTLVSAIDGPLWYRGMSLLELSQEAVDTIMSTFGAERVVIGHTIIDNENISSIYKNKVVNIDLHHKTNFVHSKMKGLLIKDNIFYELDLQHHTRLIGGD